MSHKKAKEDRRRARTLTIRTEGYEGGNYEADVQEIADHLTNTGVVGLFRVTVEHDDWCPKLADPRNACTCSPDVTATRYEPVGDA